MTIPRDGEAAHRRGVHLYQNPFSPESVEFARWRRDWLARHEHGPNHAEDGRDGSRRPRTDRPAAAVDPFAGDP